MKKELGTVRRLQMFCEFQGNLRVTQERCTDNWKMIFIRFYGYRGMIYRLQNSLSLYVIRRPLESIDFAYQIFEAKIIGQLTAAEILYYSFSTIK
jgi:hypothetical protein